MPWKTEKQPSVTKAATTPPMTLATQMARFAARATHTVLRVSSSLPTPEGTARPAAGTG
ncbi:hypothetical protein [Streptomyces sp. NBC_00354]|uniref:hypothetical protein n=1 Tax=Streptomyces sp. NBC_00354 TaxID=2975723 RepID=UPI002E257337|nr:hypothetical protein OG296_35640 [Streptomyces sp. NBC_01001]